MFYNQNIVDIEKELQTSSKGLSEAEVFESKKKYGKNILPKKEKESILKIFCYSCIIYSFGGNRCYCYIFYSFNRCCYGYLSGK